jgi:hypothetical protein
LPVDSGDRMEDGLVQLGQDMELAELMVHRVKDRRDRRRIWRGSHRW